MNGESRPSPRPLIFVILVGAIAASVVTAVRTGFVHVGVSWPDDQPALPLLVALLLVYAAMLGLTALLLPGFRIDGFWPALFGAVVVSVVSWAATRLFAGSAAR